MHTLHIDFTKPKGPKFPIYSWLIRAVEGTKFSHVRVRWTNTVGQELIFEASGRTVKLIGEHAQPKFPIDIVHTYSFDLTSEQYRKLIGLFRYSSVDYGLWQAIGILVAKVLRLEHNPFASGRTSQVCSELVALVLMEVVGITYLDLMLNLDTVGPKQIQQLLEKFND